MALRIPPRRTPLRVSLVDALNHICGEMLTAAPLTKRSLPITGIEAVIASDAQDMFVQRQRDELAREVAGVLLEAVEDGRLEVEGIPALDLEAWRSSIGIFDWPSGRFTLAGPEVPYSLRRYYTPLVHLEKAVALFEETAEAVEAVLEHPGVSKAALIEVVRGIMASERLTETQARERAAQRFAPHTFPDTLWRAAWKDEPNKLGRGEKASGKSGA